MSLQSFIEELQDVMRVDVGIANSPPYPPEKMGSFPFCVTHAGQGIWRANTEGDIVGLHNVVIEIHDARKDLARDIRASMPFGDSVPVAIWKAHLEDRLPSAMTFGSITYTYGPLQWGTDETIGWTFTIEQCKFRVGITEEA